MYGVLRSVETTLAELAAGCDPADLSGDDAVVAVHRLGTIRKLTDALAGMLAARVTETGAHRRCGDRSGTDTLARAFGVEAGEARRIVETTGKVSALAATRAAMRSGQLSMRAAQLIADAVAVNPAAEAELLRVAPEGLPPLRKACIRARVAAEDPAERGKRQHRERSLRWWTDDDGMVCGRVRLPAEIGGAIATWFEGATQKIFRDRPAGETREAREAYAADVFVALFDVRKQSEARGDAVDMIEVDNGRGGETRVPIGTNVTMHLLIDHAALVLGEALPGTTCEIAGVGPVSVEWARSLLGDAFLTAVIRKGRDITTVAHLGRHIPAELRTALVVAGRECDIEGCHISGYLEIDHEHDFAKGGPTSWDNVGWLCYEHHRRKSDGWRLGPRDPVTRKRALTEPVEARRRSDAA